jgi:HEAT repeat protein
VAVATLPRKDFDALYSALAALAREPDAPGRGETLERALRSKNAHLVARAAPLLRVEERERFTASMLAAYEHLFGGAGPRGADAAQLDPACLGKSALAEALDRLEHPLEGPFRRGVVHVQKEGPYPPSDSATGLRARCGFALVRLRVGDALEVLADLMTDPEPSVRAAGAEAVAYHGDERGTALLRMQLRHGDPEPDVLSAVVLAYLRLEPVAGLAWATGMLTGETRDAREAAAIALGEARLEGGLGPLAGYLERVVSEGEARVAVAALLMLRSERALARLREFGAERRDAHGAVAREALDRYDRALRGEADGD